MSKELPYFKFLVNDWITGDITLEDFETQGLFINICAYYWSKDCVCTLTNVKRKFNQSKPSAFESLISNKIIKIDDSGNLIINFLMEQIEEREKTSKTNSKNGRKGGRPRSKPLEILVEKPNALFSVNEQEAKKSNIEKRREEKRILNREEIDKKQTAFYNTIIPLADKFGKEICRAFFDYWKEPNKTMTKIKWEMQDTWDINLRLSRWANKNKDFNKTKVQLKSNL